MSKRFTDTDKWKKGFIRGLEPAYKLLWLYITDDCNHAGIWDVDIEVAALRIGIPLDQQKALSQLGNHIKVFDDGKKWFIPSFIEFQYGTLNPSNRAHNSVIQTLSKYQSLSPLVSPLQAPSLGAMEKDKEKERINELNESEGILKGLLGELYHRRDSTKWGDKEIKLLKVVAKRADILTEFGEIKKAWNSGWQYHRKDIFTLLGNWTGEVDRAREFMAPKEQTETIRPTKVCL
jgi:hypothetical protein